MALNLIFNLYRCSNNVRHSNSGIYDLNPAFRFCYPFLYCWPLIGKGSIMKKNHIEHLSLTILLIASPVVAYASVCEYADTIYAKIPTGVASVGVAVGVGLKVAGVTVVTHSSGAAIAATASSGYLAGTLGVIGTVTSFITAPATLVVGGVAVAAAGGTIAYCHYTKDDKLGVPVRAASAPVKAK